MEDDVILQRYKELACEAVRKGVNDYLYDKEMSDYAFYTWIQNCMWFDYLDIDRDYFYVKALRLKENKVKKTKRSVSYAKKKDR